MAIEITIPRLGWNMDEGVFAGWLKQDGEAVRAGDALFSLEGEKATQDVESFDQGVLRIPPNAPNVGDRVPVGAVIGYLVAPGESDPVDGQSPASAASASTPSASSRPTSTSPSSSTSTSTASRPGRDRPKISPLARRIARELGVDLSTIRGSGCTGRIRKVDVLEASRARATQVSPTRPDVEAPAPRALPVGAIRRTIAARMVESRHATAPVTLTTSADVTNLVSLREQFKALAAAPGSGREVPGYTDFLVKLAALALQDHPSLNARWADDRIELLDDIHVGIAVDTEAGLMVPVVRDAAKLGLGQVVASSRDLIRRAREQRLKASEMQGGTFTITNLGAFGIESFTPIINLPECAILGMGRIQRQPTMVGDQVIGRDRMSLSLTFDHRIVDGAPAARFLQALVLLIENPAPWLIA